MAVIVKNTFLDIADRESLHCHKRCLSLPRNWKPVLHDSSDDHTPTLCMASPDSSSRASLLSDFSFLSPDAFSEDISTSGSSDVEPMFAVPARCHSRTPSTVSTASVSDRCATTSSDSTCDTDDSLEFYCKTPTSSIGSPRVFARHLSHDQEMESPVCMPCTSDAANFPSAPSDPRMDAVVNAVHLALRSCGRAHHIKIEETVLNGKSSTTISAEVQRGGARSSSQPYEIVHLSKKALDAITAQLPTVALLSARVQKEDAGYSLRSSIACVPEGAEDKMCWDVFQKGCCPRRRQCRWHHPEDSDISRIKVSIRFAEEVDIVSSEKQLAVNSSAGKRKISLGDLL